MWLAMPVGWTSALPGTEIGLLVQRLADGEIEIQSKFSNLYMYIDSSSCDDYYTSSS